MYQALYTDNPLKPNRRRRPTTRPTPRKQLLPEIYIRRNWDLTRVFSVFSSFLDPSFLWDLADKQGRTGAAACIVIPWFADRYREGSDWRSLAWWIHDHLDYAHLQFFPKLFAFNVQWHEERTRRIDSFIDPKGGLTKPGMANNSGSHAQWYEGFPRLQSNTHAAYASR